MIRSAILGTLALSTTMMASAGGYGDTPPTEPYTAPAAEHCSPFTMQVYFQNGEALLSEQAQRVINASASGIEGCSIARLDISAAAKDTNGYSAANLAEERIAIVETALAARGVTTENVETAVHTPNSLQSISDIAARRVEVRVAAYRSEVS